MNETVLRFGHPATLVAEYDHWLVLLRPAQPTLGSLVLAAKSEATSFAELAPQAFVELGMVVDDIETVLRERLRFAKINYLMLMMVDPHVHFHVLPRYEGERQGAGLSIADTGWPGLPVLGDAVELGQDQITTVVAWLKEQWPKGF